MLRWCELPVRAKNMTFETFRLRKGLEEAYQAAGDIAEERANRNWLTLMAGNDVGKTHLGVAVCRRWIDRGKVARYVTAPLLLDELRRGFSNEDDRSYESRFDHFLNVPLLFMDDIGTEDRTSWVQEKLNTIVDYRLMHGLALMVTTNSQMSELPFRIASRLQRNGRVVIIDAPEYSSIPRKR